MRKLVVRVLHYLHGISAAVKLVALESVAVLVVFVVTCQIVSVEFKLNRLGFARL